MTTRIRRVRRDAATLSANVGKMKVMQDVLQSISKFQQQVDILNSEIAEKEKVLFSLMEKGKVDLVDCFLATAAITQSAGKATNLIDPKAFKKKVDEKDFFNCISVSVTKAKEVLGQKELDSITTTIPGKLGERKLSIKRKK